jgi:hypothetical protein
MEFHHRNPRTKKFNISAGAYRATSVVLAEIAKCDVICSNCHQIRTHGG